MEHTVQPGSFYEKGVDGLRTMVIGHSHYIWDGEVDRKNLTQEVLDRVRLGSERLRFFTSVARAFGHEPEAFFDKVAFFNFIPTVVASQNDWGTDEQIQHGLDRTARLLSQFAPDVAIAFSSKIWWALHHSGSEGLTYLDDRKDWIAVDRLAGRELIICRHPQGASSAYLSRVVRVAQDRARKRITN
jgi:hypothetical protein